MSSHEYWKTSRRSRFPAVGPVLLCPILLFMGCMDAFFPPTGAPPNVGVANSPKEVIDQLKKSYETRSLPLFRDLLAGDYRFYVSPTFAEQYSASKGLRYDTLSDTLEYIPGGTVYYYWSRDEELRAHEKMFIEAEDIRFTAAPSYDEDSYFYHTISDTLAVDSVYDSLGLFDSLLYTMDIDTMGVEVEMQGGEIVVVMEKGSTHIVNIEYQVFYLEREKKRWKIARWFDLGRSPN